MNYPKISVIMPSYNVYKYIRICMESVIAQTLTDLEILIIDAGSDDGTVGVLQEYADKDDRIRLVHSEKRSYGYQVNMGIRMAKGKYIGIVETDDFIEPDMYRVLYEQAENSGADYVRGLGKFYRKIADEMIVERPIRCPVNDASMFGEILNPYEHPEFVYSDRFLWLGLYRADFAKTLRLNETPGAAYQDIGFMFQVHSMAKKAVYVNQYIYHYRLDNGESSAYDKNAFGFLVQECSYKEKFLKELPIIWQKYSALELVEQTRARFCQMAFSGHFWEDALENISYIREYLAGLYRENVLHMEDMTAEAWAGLQLFLESPQSFYGFCRFDYLFKTYGVRLLRKRIGEKDVVIFGAGKRGMYCHVILTAQHIGNVRSFCDNNASLQGTRQQGLMVLSLFQAYAEYPDAVYVVSGGKYAMEMRQQLLEYGINEDKMILFAMEEDDLLLREIKDGERVWE